VELLQCKDISITARYKVLWVITRVKFDFKTFDTLYVIFWLPIVCVSDSTDASVYTCRKIYAYTLGKISRRGRIIWNCRKGKFYEGSLCEIWKYYTQNTLRQIKKLRGYLLMLSIMFIISDVVSTSVSAVGLLYLYHALNLHLVH
jgi:hypothetical protein